MGYEEQIKAYKAEEPGGNFSVSIGFSRLEREFTESSRFLVLYSDIEYRCENFNWKATMPTVRIPYRDHSMGFLVDGVLFAHEGTYQRAPGVVTDVDIRMEGSRKVEDPKIDIITSRNSTISVGYKRNGIQITFKRGGKESRVPIGVFLKAISKMPYSVILDRIEYKPQPLLNGFPCTIPPSNADLSKVPSYDPTAGQNLEPSIDECVDKVYSAIGGQQTKTGGRTTHTPLKVNRINAYLDGLHFKTTQNYETHLAMATRAIDTVLSKEIRIPVFQQDGSGLLPTEYVLEKGHYITHDDAVELQKRDISSIRVSAQQGGNGRSFTLQEETPVAFRVLGYTLARDVPELHEELRCSDTQGMLITEEVLEALNASELSYLEVITPRERKTVYRSRDNVTYGDFITILNYLCTNGFINHSDVSQYEVANRIVKDYDGKVMAEVQDTYEDIINSIAGVTDLAHLLEAMPTLPSKRLEADLRDSEHKDVVQADITNIMSRAIADTTVSAMLPEAPAAMMLVQKDQYGRMDALHSPDSKKVGAVQHLTSLSRINPDTGDVETPLEVISHGKPTGKVVYVSASMEINKYVAAWNEDFSSEVIHARFNGDVTTVHRNRVSYRDVSPYCDMSVSRMCIPFPGFSQPKRAIMATKMNGQALPLLHPQRPLVSTGAETEVPGLYYTGRQILEESNVPIQEGGVLELVGTTWSKYMCTHRFIHNGHSFEFSVPYTRTDQESLYNYNLNLNIKKPKTYELDDVVLYNQSCDIGQYETWERLEQGTVPLVKDPKKPAMALGTNLRMCYKTMGTSTVDDAVLISQRLVDDHVLSTIQIFRYEINLKQGESFSRAGNVKLHSHVYTGQPLITITREKDSGISERSVLCKQEGDVVYAEFNSDGRNRGAEVWVSTLHDAEVGDKVAGRYGNKSVIARIVPDYMMPYDPDDGRPMDIVCTPEGLPSRMNFGQVLECALGAAMDAQGKVAVVSPFYPDIKKHVETEYANAGLKPKRLFLPEYGKLSERPVMVGVLYFMKLEQIANTKLRAIGYPKAVDAVYGEPVKSVNQPKGQAIGEYESWALKAAGAHHTINNFFTFYSGDEENRRRYFNMLAGNKDSKEGEWDEYEGSRDGVGDGLVQQDGNNINALAMQTVLRMFGLDVDIDSGGEHYSFVPLDMRRITIEQTLQNIQANSFHLADNAWSKAKLEAPVVNPFWIEHFPLAPLLGMKSIRPLVEGKHYIHRNYNNPQFGRETLPENKIIEAGGNLDNYMTGMSALIDILSNTTLEMAEDFLKTGFEGDGSVIVASEDTGSIEELDEDGTPIVQESPEIWEVLPEVPMNVADLLKFIRYLRANSMTLNDLVWTYLPILPRVFRQSNVVGSNERDHSFFKHIRRTLQYSSSQEVYKSLREFIGYGAANKDDLQSIRGYFFGKDSSSKTHGAIRSNVLRRRVGFSGRAVITPAQDVHMTPFFVKLPWHVAMTQLAMPLAIRLKKRQSALELEMEAGIGLSRGTIDKLGVKEWSTVIESLYKFNPYIIGRYFNIVGDEDMQVKVYNFLRRYIQKIVEGNVTRDGLVWYNGRYVDPCDPEQLPEDATIDCAMVIFGRQPTLHKKSLRSYFTLLCDGDTNQLHHAVCEAYNADFDGDTMYTVQLFGQAKNECCRTVSVLQDLISEKDGSYTLALVQDVALGIYCATTFQNNVAKFTGRTGDFVYFNDLQELQTQLEYGDLPYYKAVVFESKDGNFYCSTAGRILVNAAVPGCLTNASFTDPEGIAKQVLGEGWDMSRFKELKYDMPWVTTKERPAGRSTAVKIGDVQLETYEVYGARESVMTTQRLYEIGIVASDVYSVSISMEDMHVDTSYPPDAEHPNGGDIVQDCMKEPQEIARKLNSLYQMGLISDAQRRESVVKAWDNSRKQAQAEIIGRLRPDSNTFYMMYSGARGKPAQVMQTVGFVGTISKTNTEDIELPILRGYGQGLSSLDLARTNYSARIGVIATQSGTQDTGYATRQSVYMTSGMNISEDDCSQYMPESDNPDDTRAQRKSRVHIMQVEYGGGGGAMCIREDGTTFELGELVGDIFLSGAPRDSKLARALGRCNFLVNEEVVDLLQDEVDLELEFEDHGRCRIGQPDGISSEWRKMAVEGLYSYALPYTVNGKITEETVDWIERENMREVVAYPKSVHDDGPFHLEAYLPVEYDTSQHTLVTNGQQHGDEVMFTKVVSESSEGYHYYRNLLEDGRLTAVALSYLTKKKIHSVDFEDGTHTTVTYKLSHMFTDLVLGRVSEGLPYLLDDHTITRETLKAVEELQLQYIPVYTGVTCLSRNGICRRCYGRSMSTKKFLDVGTNLGITASQTMSEPLSQATLNVGHSGGQRSLGTNQLSGLNFFNSMMKGTMGSARAQSQIERFATQSGYVEQNPHDRKFIQIVSEDGSRSEPFSIDDPSRLNVPSGAYVDVGDTLVAGLPDLNRYEGTYVFGAALKTRMMLLKEYYKVFESLDVSTRNAEVLARAQTSNAYAVKFTQDSQEKIRDTAEESVINSNAYTLRVSTQAETVMRYTGVAAFAFQDVGNMLKASVLNPESLTLNSFLGNLVTGTEVGSETPKFIPRDSAVYRKSSRVQTFRSKDSRERSVFGENNVGKLNALEGPSIAEEAVARFKAIASGDEEATQAALLEPKAQNVESIVALLDRQESMGALPSAQEESTGDVILEAPAEEPEFVVEPADDSVILGAPEDEDDTRDGGEASQFGGAKKLDLH